MQAMKATVQLSSAPLDLPQRCLHDTKLAIQFQDFATQCAKLFILSARNHAHLRGQFCKLTLHRVQHCHYLFFVGGAHINCIVEMSSNIIKERGFFTIYEALIEAGGRKSRVPTFSLESILAQVLRKMGIL